MPIFKILFPKGTELLEKIEKYLSIILASDYLNRKPMSPIGKSSSEEIVTIHLRKKKKVCSHRKLYRV